MIDISDDFFEFLHDYGFFDNRFNFLDCLILVSDLDNFFIFSDNLLDLFNNDGYLHDLLNYVLDIPVDIDNLGDNPFYFNNLGNFDDFLLESFDFIYFGNSVGLLHNLFNNLLSSHNFLDYTLDWNNFFYNSFDFFEFFSNIWDLLNDLLILNIVNDFLLHSWDFSNLNNLLFN